MSSENNESTSEFDDFVAAGEVEVGAPSIEEPKSEETPEENSETENEQENAVEEEDQLEETDENQEEASEEDKEKPRNSKESHIDRLKRERAKAQKEARELRKRLEEVEKGELLQRLENLEKGLPANNGSDTTDSGNPEPDPTDPDKYPLGHLDDRYIEDKLEWLADKKAAERADAVLQRQQEHERNQAVQQTQKELLDKVDDLALRGADIFEDFQESVVETGMRGDWDLTQETFEAAHEAENGVQILYDLSQDKKEASRVAKLSPYQQVKYVQEKNAEISKSAKPRRIPQAGEPPKNTARGANSRTQINPATENLDDFEKAWELDAKRGNK